MFCLVRKTEVTKYDVYVCSFLLHIIFNIAKMDENSSEQFFKEKHFPALENRLHLDSAPVKGARL